MVVEVDLPGWDSAVLFPPLFFRLGVAGVIVSVFCALPTPTEPLCFMFTVSNNGTPMIECISFEGVFGYQDIIFYDCEQAVPAKMSFSRMKQYASCKFLGNGCNVELIHENGIIWSLYMKTVFDIVNVNEEKPQVMLLLLVWRVWFPLFDDSYLKWLWLVFKFYVKDAFHGHLWMISLWL